MKSRQISLPVAKIKIAAFIGISSFEHVNYLNTTRIAYALAVVVAAVVGQSHNAINIIAMENKISLALCRVGY